jgi:hypothetical protein
MVEPLLRLLLRSRIARRSAQCVFGAARIAGLIRGDP